MGGEPAEMFRKAIAEFGGMGKFVKAGQKVVVKPNIGWDKVPELAGNTNPELVSEIIKQCFDAGAKEVVVFDHTCDDWRKCYKNSGIEEAAKAAGAKVMPAHEESYYREVELPKAKSLKTAKIHSAILDCDVWINVPILKNHGGAKMTISMKNHMGIVWDRGFFHRNDLQQCIADICTISKPAVLNVVDAYRLMKTNGPRGKSEADVVLAKGVFMSPDIVAVDTAATKFFNQVEKMPLELAVDLPQEEEFALANMMPYTYYNFWFLPKHQQEYADKYLLFDDISEAELKVFEETFTRLIKISLWNTHGTQFLSKNPPHTGRVKELVKMFPNAKFIYLMRNPYTVFESTRSFFTNTIQPLKLQDITPAELEQNILSIYAKLYHKYEADKASIPAGNLIEVKFEDFEADAMGMTEHIYDALSIPGFADARTAIEQYVGGKKGYKKNKYKYDDRTVQLVQDNWGFALKQWNYEL